MFNQTGLFDPDPLDHRIRAFETADVKTILRISREVSEEVGVKPMTDTQFGDLVTSKGVSCLVVGEKLPLKHSGWSEIPVIGYCVIRQGAKSGYIYEVAVDRSQRRRGFGSCLVRQAIDLIFEMSYPEVQLVCRESNVDAQLFWRAMGFRAVKVIREHFKDSGEDAYCFKRKRFVNSPVSA